MIYCLTRYTVNYYYVQTVLVHLAVGRCSGLLTNTSQKGEGKRNSALAFYAWLVILISNFFLASRRYYQRP